MAETNESLVGVYNLIIPQGSDTDINLTYKVNNVIQDLTGYTGTLQVRDKDYGDTVLLQLTTAGSEVVFDANNSPNITVTFPAAKTTAMTTYTGMIYDLEMVDTSGTGRITRVLKGTFKLDREVTL